MGLPQPFDQAMIDAICDVAIDSKIASYSWRDRGIAPPGYTMGMALAFGMAVQRYRAGDPAAIEMAKANTHDDDYDALSWYDSDFAALGLNNETAGLDTLRHLFALMLGLGMRESSGKHCEGRDMSADNVSSDTAEAGLFQTSWNIRSCSSLIDRLFEEYLPSLDDDLPQCYLEQFEEDVSCSSDDWANYGSGNGFKYQKMSKNCPPFHAEVTAIGLRRLRQHWGPINRKEAELRKDADTMLKSVQALVEGTAPPEEVAMKVVISSGHGLHIRGAAGPSPWGLDEVDEARRVVPKVAEYLRSAGAEVKTYNDDISDDQTENLNRIVDYHNAQTRDLDVSVHFNCYDQTAKGTECLYVTQQALAGLVADKIAACGFVDRGPKERTDLFFLNNTEEPAILIETCFVDNKQDADTYRARFDDICHGIAEAILGRAIAPPGEIVDPPDPPVERPPVGVATVDIQITATGPVRITVNGQDLSEG